MASGTDMLSSDDRIDVELDATLKFYKVVNFIEKRQTASCQIPDDIYEADSEDYLSEAESLQSILTNAYLHLEASVVCEVSSAAKNMKATLMEELTYEIKYLQSITLKITDVESTNVPSDVTELTNIETVLPVCIAELSIAYPDSTEQISLALHAVDPFSSTVTDSHTTKLLAQFVSTDSTTVTRCSAMHQECHSTDTEGHIIYHSKFWDHPNDIYDNQKTPEYVSIVQSCHSVYNCEILYLLLYS